MQNDNVGPLCKMMKNFSKVTRLLNTMQADSRGARAHLGLWLRVGQRASVGGEGGSLLFVGAYILPSTSTPSA